MNIKFEAISPEEFEFLIEEILVAKSFTIISRPARGPDQGSDLIAERHVTDDMGVANREIWLVECKHNATSGKSVKEADIGNFELKMKQHNANRYLLATTTAVSVTVKNQIQALSNDNSSNRKAIFWQNKDLCRLAEEYKSIFRRYQPWLEEAEKLCEHIRNDHRLFSSHRGVMPWKDILVVYGNDGYDPVPEEGISKYVKRTRRQVEILQQGFDKMNIKQLAFGKSKDGATWVILVESTDIKMLQTYLTAAFILALEEQQKDVD